MKTAELYMSLFEECRGEYEKAVRAGRRNEAHALALRCASILLNLAGKNPRMAELYMARAEEWERKAEELEKKPEVEKRETLPAGKGSTPTSTNPYLEYVEGLIARSTVTWKDIGGLEEVKKLIARNVALALAEKPAPIKPWKGILLFGPPGTGKTLLASAAAGSLNATFFSVKASDVLSKYYGESSKIVSALYALAREKAPSIVFIDEIDALTVKREGAHEATRRTLATLLSELDGFKGQGDVPVLTLASTNTPWDLDEAVLSRFPLRVYVPLPDKEATKEIIKTNTRGLDISRLDLDAIAEESVRRLYSGREIASLCNLAIHNMLDEMNPELSDLDAISKSERLKLKVRPLEMGDFEEAFKKIKSPLTRKDIERYEKWAEEFGA
ncbi:cell division protein [Thermococcus profundus]|uniref:Cell division protein n=1 Tax=Thermococcus profundus TaxID=49899 RepID=A0A2Z2MD93_THEPR|nr:ATP-binding protein [Thermococcus profundus]ASJ03499.1 cell division protein [Thermococcus profundus]